MCKLDKCKQIRKIMLITLLLWANILSAQTMRQPEWIKDLIVYEISTKNFTSPKGQGTGTFQSTKERVPYLADLGINGVWLAGSSWADNGHFYGIWTQYACIRPDSIEPTLGTPSDFRSLVDEFHKYKIKVFLDVITHGVMNESPLIHEHPEWFKGGSWGMTDYDWSGNHDDLDAWWVQTHVDYVLKYGVDGFRLDVDIYRPDLWREIKKRCADAGHPIVVFLEWDRRNESVCDFFQRMERLSELLEEGVNSDKTILSNTALFFNNKFQNRNDFTVLIHYQDGTVEEGSTLRDGKLSVTKLAEPEIPVDIEKSKQDKNYRNIELLVENIDTTKHITNIDVIPRSYRLDVKWTFGSDGQLYSAINTGESMRLYLEPFVPDLHYYSVDLSDHDEGWENFPKEQNPYVAEGSRCLFGYSCLFTPAIPLFMSGEEFDAKFSPNPKLTPDLYGKGTPGDGTWLYGAIIDWEQLNQKEQRDMLQDVKRMISIRKEEADIFHAYLNDTLPDLFELQYESSIKIPVPFAMQNTKKIIIVAGNNTNQDVKCKIKMPLQHTGINPDKTYTIHDLWNDRKWKIKGKELEAFQFEIKRDKVSGGGISVFKILK